MTDGSPTFEQLTRIADALEALVDRLDQLSVELRTPAPSPPLPEAVYARPPLLEVNRR